MSVCMLPSRYFQAYSDSQFLGVGNWQQHHRYVVQLPPLTVSRTSFPPATPSSRFGGSTGCIAAMEAKAVPTNKPRGVPGRRPKVSKNRRSKEGAALSRHRGSHEAALRVNKNSGCSSKSGFPRRLNGVATRSKQPSNKQQCILGEEYCQGDVCNSPCELEHEHVPPPTYNPSQPRGKVAKCRSIRAKSVGSPSKRGRHAPSTAKLAGPPIAGASQHCMCTDAETSHAALLACAVSDLYKKQILPTLGEVKRRLDKCQSCCEWFRQNFTATLLVNISSSTCLSHRCHHASAPTLTPTEHIAKLCRNYNTAAKKKATEILGNDLLLATSDSEDSVETSLDDCLLPAVSVLNKRKAYISAASVWQWQNDLLDNSAEHKDVVGGDRRETCGNENANDADVELIFDENSNISLMKAIMALSAAPQHDDDMPHIQVNSWNEQNSNSSLISASTDVDNFSRPKPAFVCPKVAHPKNYSPPLPTDVHHHLLPVSLLSDPTDSDATEMKNLLSLTHSCCSNLTTKDTKSNLPINSTDSNLPINSTDSNPPTNSTDSNLPTNKTFWDVFRLCKPSSCKDTYDSSTYITFASYPDACFEGFVDPNSLSLPYDLRCITVAVVYVLKLVQQGITSFKAGRFLMAQALKKRGPRELRVMTLGQLCHLVQLLLTNSFISYDCHFIRPVVSCQSLAKAVCGRMSAQYVTQKRPNVEVIKRNVKTLLTSHPGGIVLSQLRNMYEVRFGQPLEFNYLGFTKLAAFIGAELSDSCVMKATAPFNSLVLAPDVAKPTRKLSVRCHEAKGQTAKSDDEVSTTDELDVCCASFKGPCLTDSDIPLDTNRCACCNYSKLRGRSHDNCHSKAKLMESDVNNFISSYIVHSLRSFRNSRTISYQFGSLVGTPFATALTSTDATRLLNNAITSTIYLDDSTEGLPTITTS